MFKILSKRRLNPTMTWLVIDAPLVAKKARPGQFIILRTDEYGERIPLTMAGHDAEKGTIDLIYAAVGRTTMPVSYTHLLYAYRSSHPLQLRSSLIIRRRCIGLSTGNCQAG